MTSIDRRRFAGGLAAFCGGSLLPIGSASAATLHLPPHPMRLGRMVERQLFDGARIVVARDWIVSFGPLGRGFEVRGRQIRVSVDAPEKLAPLAEIERQRSTNDRFPILLDDNGRIVGGGNEDEAANLDAAVREAERIINLSSQSEERRESAISSLAGIQAAGGNVLETMPTDLFFPAGGEQSASRKLALPGGSTGEFELLYRSQIAADGPWLLRSERLVTTRLEGSERVSRELWQMEPG